MKIYVASSWRNERQPSVVRTLRTAGHEVYDFRHPDGADDGFHWSQIDKNWELWSPEKYRKALSHSVATDGFGKDMTAMEWADVFVGVQPFGRSASMEMGWAAGKGKPTILLLAHGEQELMVKMFSSLCCSMDEVLEMLRYLER